MLSEPTKIGKTGSQAHRLWLPTPHPQRHISVGERRNSLGRPRFDSFMRCPTCSLCSSACSQPSARPSAPELTSRSKTSPFTSSSPTSCTPPPHACTGLARHHNSQIPHSAFSGQTPDEMYFGMVANLPAELAAARQLAPAARLATNRRLSCER
jgi:hypothetical protein